MVDKPLTKKEMKAACKGAYKQTRLKVRRGFQAAPIRYKVLKTQSLSPADKKIVTKGLLKAFTPAEAQKLVDAEIGMLTSKHKYSNLDQVSPWQYRNISHTKDFECGLLLYKGLDVALFYKRQCSEVEPLPDDPVPVGALEHPDQMWARLDLFSKSVYDLLGDIRRDNQSMDLEIDRLKQEVADRDALLEAAERDLKALRTQVSNLQHKPGWNKKKGKSNAENNQS